MALKVSSLEVWVCCPQNTVDFNFAQNGALVLECSSFLKTWCFAEGGICLIYELRKSTLSSINCMTLNCL